MQGHPPFLFLLALALCLFLFWTLGEVSPKKDYGNKKDDDDIFDAVGLEEVYRAVQIIHHPPPPFCILTP